MFKSYFKIGWRNILKNKGYSVINIGGLAAGMTVALLIALWVNDELSYNKNFENYDRIAQVMQHQTVNGEKGTQNSIPLPLGNELQKSYSNDFSYVVLSSWTGDHVLSTPDISISKSGNFMDIDAPKLFSLKMIDGTYNCLSDPKSILLSQSAASALFGEKDPMGQIVKIDNSTEVKVTGIFEDFPRNSDLHEITFIAPWQLNLLMNPWVERSREEWDNNAFQLYVQIAEHADMNSLSAKIKNTKYDHLSEGEKVFKAEIFLHPMKDWHLRSNWYNGNQTGGLIEYVWLFGLVAFFVLLLACINFMNLSTARSEQRAKEVGIRKSIGSLKAQLVSQFLSESLLIVTISFILTIFFASVLLPWFNELAVKRIVLPLNNASFWIVCLSFIAITGIVSGSYPAFYLSSFQPIKVLKGAFKTGRSASLPRRVLVVVQFTVSVTLIIGTVVVYRQIEHTKNRPLGFDTHNVVMMEIITPEFVGKYNALRNELKKIDAIEEMAESSSPLNQIYSNSDRFNWEGKDPELQGEFGTIFISDDYGKTVSWKIREGRDFSQQFADSSSVILNQAALKFMNVEDPIGKTIQWGINNPESYTIIGVVEDMLLESPYYATRPSLYFHNTDRENWILFKLNQNQSISKSLEDLEHIFKKHFPAVPFNYEFADQQHEQKFAAEKRIGILSGIFAAFAIFISSIGLLGLTSFVAEQRTKEIGIRKVMGASVISIWKMLSKDFIILVTVSCLIAMPIANYLTSKWLINYGYRTDISWWIFVASGVGALAITIATVSIQAIKAAIANPINSLRSE
ncbi:ABC transporter permease [Fulvivirgaceae bacterium PWU20]|uniref:ABC transporter permease n=2 Tax=Chryseosolibacter indicus TaxID=2782351 RepID=A0ABS5VUQ0_9BACT|nr:ABC transporter permease [Chryseosolibacter indicus]